MSILSALGNAAADVRTLPPGVTPLPDGAGRTSRTDIGRTDLNRAPAPLRPVLDGRTPTGIPGQGPDIDGALRTQAEDLTARAGGSDVRHACMQTLMTALGASGGGNPALVGYADQFAAAWKTLEILPNDNAARQQVIYAADVFSGEIRRISQGVEDLDGAMKDELHAGLDTLNDLFRQVGDINAAIGTGAGDTGAAGKDTGGKDTGGKDTGGRGSLIRRIGDLIGVHTLERSDGRIAIFTASGVPLVDREAGQLVLEDGGLSLRTGDGARNVSDHIRDGRIGTLYTMSRDGSTLTPPQPPRPDQGQEIIRKLRAQLDAYARAFVTPAGPGEPSSVTAAYDAAQPVQDGELASGFFTGTDRLTLAVNPQILSGETLVKAAAGKTVAEAASAHGRALFTEGLAMRNATYSGMAAGLTGQWVAAASTAATRCATDIAARDSFETRARAVSAVSLEDEIGTLHRFQASHMDALRVMRATSSMFDALANAA
jgi:flagellar hook-associated protein 1 FlgK